MREVRLGMIGAGKMALWHLRAYARLKGVRATTIANPNSDRGRRLASKFGIASHYADAMEMIRREPLDAVDICTPTQFHHPFLLAAMERGLHAYVEKPLCLDARQAAQVVDANRRHGRIIFNGFNYRHWPHMQRMRAVIESGRIGRVRFVRLMRTTKDTPEMARQEDTPGEIFSALHCHLVDLLYLMGLGDPQSVFAQGTTVCDWPECPDSASVLLRYPSGALAELTASTACPGLTPEILVLGSHGSLRVDWGRVSIIPHRDVWPLTSLVSLMFRQAITIPHRVLRNPFSDSCKHFIHCIVSDRRGECDEHQALRVLRVTDAARESYLSGQSVALGG